MSHLTQTKYDKPFASSTTGRGNRFHYRGYYYDSESELYYLQSRDWRNIYMMTRKDRSKTLGFISLALAIVLTIIFSEMKLFENMTEDNTVEYAVTVRSIEKKEVGKSGTEIMIYTDQFSNAFRVMGRLCGALDMDKLLDVKQGDKISFRIEATESALLSDKPVFVDVVSMKTDDSELLSLNEYNRIMHDTLMPTKVVNVALIVILFGLAIFFFARTKKQRR